MLLMKSYSILLTVTLLISSYVPCDGLFNGQSLQEFVENIVDVAQFKKEGIESLNDTAIGHIWSFFKSKYHRDYLSSGEEHHRLQIFRDHLKYVLESNFEKLRTFRLELNEFADWTLNEFNSLKKGLILPQNLRRNLINSYDNNDDDEDESVRRSLAKLYQDYIHSRRLKRNIYGKRNQNRRFFFDWFKDWFGKDKDKNNNVTNILDYRTKNLVSSIKNQLKCGACYAFATATVFEALYTMKTKSNTVIDFSAQQIADCSTNGNNGCRGGNFQPSVQYLAGQGNKIATDASYPYVGQKQDCKKDGINLIDLGNIEYNAIPEGDEKKIEEALTNYGPVFIGLDADSKRFMFYKSGILNINNCPKRQQDMDHALTIIGYGYDNTLQMPYWIIKNSWGTKWGENGYLRLAKDAGNMCGVASMAQYAKLT